MDQDWKTVVLRNPKKIEQKNLLLYGKDIIKKTDLAKPSVNSSIKLDENDNVVTIKYVPKEISQLIVNARNLKKITRKQLATQLNLKEDIITSIENGKAIYDGNLIAKIKKMLNVK